MTEPRKNVYIPRGNTGGSVVVNNKSGICPIYPVRYAYVNFFEKDLSKPAAPPPLSQLLNAGSIPAGNGYMVRLLREGWVYIREEDDEANGYFHIFRYEQIEHYGEIVERFSKHLFKNGVNAQGGIKEDNTGRAGNKYPFVFVRKGINEVSIAYSEHQWSPNVIDHLNANAADRAKSMQRVNLTAANDPYALPATKENLAQLIEDYKQRKNRFLAAQAGAKLEPKTAGLDLLTTAESYDMNADNIAKELARVSRYSNNARIVSLHDPVGRQKEIAYAHARLTLWQQSEAAENIYPYTIGRMVNDLRKVKDGSIQKIVEKSINWQEHGDYWNKMDARFKQFDTRLAQFAQLYQVFMQGSPQEQPGSLSTYFKYFFAAKSADDAATELEIQTLCKVTTGLFDGILSSQPGNIAMENILNEAANNASNNTVSYNVMHIIFVDVLAKLVTQPQKTIDWSPLTIKQLDKALTHLAPLIGKVMSAASAGVNFSAEVAKRGFNTLTFNALDYVTNRLVPTILGIYGIKFNVGNTVTLSSDELARVIAKMIDQTNGSSRQAKAAIEAILNQAEIKLKRGQRLFDWAERIKNTKLPKLYTLSTADIKATKYKRYEFAYTEGKLGKAALVFDTGFAGLSAIFNVCTIYDLANKTQFTDADPLKQGGQLQTIATFTAAFTALTVDAMVLTRGGLAVADKLLPKASVTVVTALAPAIKAQSQLLSQLLKGSASVSARLIVVANLAGAISSTLLGVNALKAGNTGEATGHFMVAGGSAILLFQGLVAMGAVLMGTGAATAYTGVGIVVAAVGLLLIIAGAVTVFLFGRSSLEHLLLNCFWGEGKMYAFWSTKLERPDILTRLGAAKSIQQDKVTQDSYQLELQEFMNLLNMPKLTLAKEVPFAATLRDLPRQYTYNFTLPNFQPGVSEVYFGLYTASGFHDNGLIKMTIDKPLTAQFATQMKNAQIQYLKGAAQVRVSLSLKSRAKLIWLYEPQPGTIVPLRWLMNGNVKTQPLIGMVDEGTQ